MPHVEDKSAQTGSSPEEYRAILSGQFGEPRNGTNGNVQIYELPRAVLQMIFRENGSGQTTSVHYYSKPDGVHHVDFSLPILTDCQVGNRSVVFSMTTPAGDVSLRVRGDGSADMRIPPQPQTPPVSS